MPSSQVYRMSSYESPGYGAIIGGNFVDIAPGLRGYHVHVQAYHNDPNGQYRHLDTFDAAIDWAVETAKTHRGEPNQRVGIETWATVAECSITARRLPSGEYESGYFPMRINCDHYPYLDNPQTFPTMAEALADARKQAEEWLESERRQEAEMDRIRTALEAAADR